jgi:hypothetical protein
MVLVLNLYYRREGTRERALKPGKLKAAAAAAASGTDALLLYTCTVCMICVITPQRNKKKYNRPIDDFYFIFIFVSKCLLNDIIGTMFFDPAQKKKVIILWEV